MNLRSLGTVTRSHGLKGAFKINITVEGDPQLKENEPIFIRLQGGSVPFFVQEVFMRSANSVVVKVEDVDSIEATDRFIGKAVELPTEQFSEPEQDDPNSLIGFAVHDINHGAIGIISGVMPLPQHPVLEVEKDGKEILIPYVEDVIIEIELQKKQVNVETPDGLIDLYLKG